MTNDSLSIPVVSPCKPNFGGYCRGFTVKIPVKVAPMARTAPLSAPVKTMWTAHRSMELVSAKKVMNKEKQLIRGE